MFSRALRPVWLASFLTLCLTVQPTLASAQVPAKPKPRTPAAPAGPGPVHRPLSAATTVNHGLPAGQRPPVVPPGTRAAGPTRHLTAAQLKALPKPAPAKSIRAEVPTRPADGPPAPPAGAAKDLVLRSGFALDDTSLVLYFDVADPGLSAWSAWRATVYDPETGTAQDSVSLAADVPVCGAPRKFCRSFGARDGWTLVDGHEYFVTVTATLKDGTQVTSDASAKAKARATASPPTLPAAQAAGCACGNVLAPTTIGQAVRASGVNTGTGAFTLVLTDLRMAGFGIPFQAVRKYSSTNTTAGSLGVGWAWTYDVRVIPPAGGETAVSVRADDGAQVTYTRNDDGSFARPPGVRSNLKALDGGGWQLVSPDQVTYSFDATGRLTSVKNARGLGTTITYTATAWTITDAAGRKVTVSARTDGLIQKLTLPDGRSVKYGYSGGLLTSATDAEGNTWEYVYSGQLLTKVIDPDDRVQVVNTYAGGRVSKQSDALGNTTTFFFDVGKQEARTVDADGVVYFDGYSGNVLIYTQNGNGDTTNHRYDASVDPNLLVDAKGNQIASLYDPAGNMTSVTAPEPFSYTVSNTYDPHNNLTSHTDGLGHTATFGYTAFDELNAITDPKGDKTVLRVDDRGLVTALEDPRHKVTTMDYDAVGNLIAQTSPLGEKSTYRYDGTGRLTSVTDPRGNVTGNRPADFTTRFVYDNVDRLRKSFDPGKDEPWETVYDDLGQLVRTVNPVGSTTSYTYQKVIGRTDATTDPNGNTTRITYTAAGRRASVTDPAGNKTTFAYDNRGNLSAVVSPRGNVKGGNPAPFTTMYTYDFNNNRVRASHPYPGGGFVTRDTGFDELNRPVSATDPLGRKSTASYDNNHAIVSTVDPLGQATRYDYDENGRPSAVTAPAGGELKTEYDEAGNPVKRTSPTGGVTTWTYDDDGRVATTVEARGNAPGANPAEFTTTYSYDAASQLTAVADPLGNTMSFAYDANKRVVGNTNQNGHTTRYTYDEADRLVKVIGPTANRNNNEPSGTVYKYDAAGHVLTRTDPNGHTNKYTYDVVGRVVTAADGLGRQSRHAYDAEGNLTQFVAPGSGDVGPRSIVNTYDLLNRKVGQDLGAGQVIYAFGYDAKNRLTSLADPSGLRLQEYDPADRLTKVSRGENQVFTYGYDGNGNITSRTWPDGTRIGTAYDAANRMTELTAQGGVAGDKATYTFGYDPAGRPGTTTYPASTGLVTDRGYDRAGRLVDLNTHKGDTVVARYQIGRDKVGSPTAVTTTRGTASQAVAYTYDAFERVTAACYGADTCAGTPPGKMAYKYDAVGNRLSQTLTGNAGGGTTQYKYDAADQLTSATAKTDRTDLTNNNTVTFEYDQMGNLTRAGADRFAYNLDHTMASATVGGRTTSFAYDAQGLRLTAISGTGPDVAVRAWANDVNADLPYPVLESTAQGGKSTNRGFVVNPAHTTPVALLADGKANSFVPDFTGGVADVVSPSGDPLVAYDFDPFGNPRTNGTAGTVTPDPGVDNPIKFHGGYQDASLGARYAFPARAYDPATGRFGGVDPVSQPRRAPAVSRYAYVENRPTSFRDPSGASSDPDHDAAEELALEQLDARYGAFNVYAGDVPGRQSLQGRAGSICVATASPKAGDPARSCPDIIVRFGASTLVYEVKPASDQLSSIKPNLPQRGLANANQVQRYVDSLVAAGYPNVKPGDDIVPATRTYADGSTLTIFSGADWANFAPKGKRIALNYSGIIYYVRTRPPPVPPPGRPNKPPAEEPIEEPIEKPIEKPVEVPRTDPVDEPVVDDVGDDILVAAAVVVVAVVVIAAVVLIGPEVIVGAAIAGLAAWAFSW